MSASKSKSKSEKDVVIPTTSDLHPKRRDPSLWRDLTSYWILGLCNNYGYVVMLSAAHDIIGQFHEETPIAENEGGNGRECHIVSTGAILLADILPSLFVKILMPFTPMWVNVRIAFAVAFSAAGFLLVGFAAAEWQALLGVVITSASSGIGEATFLSYSSHYSKNVVSTWSSGTGGAGVIGSLSYAMLRSLNVSPRDTMLIMLFFPLLESFSFWGLLRKPTLLPVASVISTQELIIDEAPLLGFKEKLIYIKQLIKYMIPLASVYFFEYFINQGLFELVYFENTFLDKASQYRWLNVDYQIGVFISRSSVNLFHLNRIWLMSVFQFINVIYFLTEVIYFFTPSIWITFVIVLWEGLLGGGAYVNTFYRMSKDIPTSRRQFAMAMVVQSDSYGIALAGFLAIPAHNAICSLPAAVRAVTWIALICWLLSPISIILIVECSATKPHIVLILADDLGFDDVSFRGSNEFLTPNIDALGYHGIILDRFYGAALSTPSRAALLTGLYPIHTGTQYSTLGNGAVGSLPTNLDLMSDIFQKAGYSTNLIGKWNLGHARKEHTPTYRGFDRHFGYWGSHIDHYQRRAKAPAPCNHSTGYDFRRDLSLDCSRLGTYITDLFTEEAENIIIEHANGKPLFLMISHAVPHAPLQAPQEELQKFRYIKDPGRRTYAAMVSILDRSIGRVIRALERANILENSIIIFSSDNGAASVGRSKNSGSNWPLRGQKDSPWEGGIRLPAVIWSPLLNTARQRILRQSVYIADWLPTLMEAAGITESPVQTLDGKNVWPILVDENSEGTGSTENNRAILHALDSKRHIVSYTRGPWKYINGTTQNGLHDNVLTYRELYDVDPRAQRYVVEVRNSLVSKALSRFDVQRLTQHRIISLKQAASVRCGNMQRGCNALMEECLFNIEEDPCEQNNLVYERKHMENLRTLRAEIQLLQATAVQPIETSCSKTDESDPALRDCVWSNFLDEMAGSTRRSCDTDTKTPCG